MHSKIFSKILKALLKSQRIAIFFNAIKNVNIQVSHYYVDRFGRKTCFVSENKQYFSEQSNNQFQNAISYILVMVSL